MQCFHHGPVRQCRYFGAAATREFLNCAWWAGNLSMSNVLEWYMFTTLAGFSKRYSIRKMVETM